MRAMATRNTDLEQRRARADGFFGGLAVTIGAAFALYLIQNGQATLDLVAQLAN